MGHAIALRAASQIVVLNQLIVTSPKKGVKPSNRQVQWRNPR
jgi:hypothetical protein